MNVSQVLAPLFEPLEADGYVPRLTEEAGVVRIDVQAGPDACEDCLLPKEFLRSMVDSALSAAGCPSSVSVKYPGEDSFG